MIDWAWLRLAWALERTVLLAVYCVKASEALDHAVVRTVLRYCRKEATWHDAILRHVAQRQQMRASVDGGTLVCDGFGSHWQPRCLECGDEVQVIRPGKAGCVADQYHTIMEVGAAECPECRGNV